MADILGPGVTHSPLWLGTDRRMAFRAALDAFNPEFIVMFCEISAKTASPHSASSLWAKSNPAPTMAT